MKLIIKFIISLLSTKEVSLLTKEVLIELIRIKFIFDENKNNNIIVESVKIIIAFLNNLMI